MIRYLVHGLQIMKRSITSVKLNKREQRGYPEYIQDYYWYCSKAKITRTKGDANMNVSQKSALTVLDDSRSCKEKQQCKNEHCVEVGWCKLHAHSSFQTQL